MNVHFASQLILIMIPNLKNCKEQNVNKLMCIHARIQVHCNGKSKAMGDDTSEASTIIFLKLILIN